MTLYDVFYDLTRLEIRLWDRVDAALRAEIDVPLGRFEAMLVMSRLGTCRIQDISQALSVTVGGTSKLIDRIEESGHCTRSPNPDDRRSSLITLAPTALPLLEQGKAAIESILEAALGAHLSDEGLNSLRDQLRILKLANENADASQVGPAE